MNSKRFVAGILVLCLFLMGCSKGTNGAGLQDETKERFTEVESTEDVDYIAQYQTMEDNDLFASGWNRQEVKNAEHFMAFTDYIPEIFPQNEPSERFHRGYFADAENIYSLDTYYSVGEDGRNYDTSYLNILDGITRKVRTITYKAQGEPLGLMMMCPYLAGGRIFTANFGMDDDGNMNAYYMVELLEDGTVNRMSDLCGIAAEKGMLSAPYTVPSMKLYYEPANDRYYMISPEEDSMFLIDGDGNVLPWQEEGAREIYVLAASKEGRLIFVRMDGTSSSCFYYDGDEKKVLFSGEKGVVGGNDMSTIDGHGKMLFTQATSVIEWDTVSGTQERIFVDNTVDESFNYDLIDCVMRNANGEVLTLRNNNLRVLTAKGPTKQVTIRIKPMLYFDDMLKRSIRKYEQTHPGVTIQLQAISDWNNWDRDTIQLVQEMSQGDGPDLLLLDRDQMLSFDKNECLMDLTDILVPSTASQILPGIWDYGKTEHGTMLLSYEPRLKTAIVNKKYLKGYSWTVQELVNLIEDREKSGKPFALLTRGDYHPFFLFITNIFDSEFVDLEAGTCTFDSPLFVKVLEICKRYDKPIDYQEDAYRQMLSDDLLTITPIGMNIGDYSRTCASLGENFVMAGYPSLSGQGNHMDFSMGFAVNQNTEQKEVIADFLNWLFSLENEGLVYEVPVRSDLFEGRIELPSEGKSWPDTPYINLSGGNVWPLAAKPDGNCYVQEFMELVENSRYDAGNVWASPIRSILWEEADAYFQGNGKTAEETARVIQSRVNLYLQENR